MKKILCLIFIIIGLEAFAAYEESDYDPYFQKNNNSSLSLYSGSYGKQPSNIGVGLNLGTNKGINVVYQNLVINTGFKSIPVVGGSQFEVDLSLDMIFRNVNEEVVLPIYYGAGVRLSSASEQKLGIRGIIGLGAFLTDVDENLEIFGEFNPTVYLPLDANLISFEFSFGARYYF